MDSLMSIVQMPRGIPVATVAIGGAENAALLAAQIISTSEGNIRENLKLWRKKLTESVINNPDSGIGTA